MYCDYKKTRIARMSKSESESESEGKGKGKKSRTARIRVSRDLLPVDAEAG